MNICSCVSYFIDDSDFVKSETKTILGEQTKRRMACGCLGHLAGGRVAE